MRFTLSGKRHNLLIFIGSSMQMEIRKTVRRYFYGKEVHFFMVNIAS